MPDWSPVRRFGGYAASGDLEGAAGLALQRKLAMSCGGAHSCGVRGHNHATAWSTRLPISDLKGFWGALGSCRAV